MNPRKKYSLVIYAGSAYYLFLTTDKKDEAINALNDFNRLANRGRFVSITMPPKVHLVNVDEVHSIQVQDKHGRLIDVLGQEENEN